MNVGTFLLVEFLHGYGLKHSFGRKDLLFNLPYLFSTGMFPSCPLSEHCLGHTIVLVDAHMYTPSLCAVRVLLVQLSKLSLLVNRCGELIFCYLHVSVCVLASIHTYSITCLRPELSD